MSSQTKLIKMKDLLNIHIKKVNSQQREDLLNRHIKYLKTQQEKKEKLHKKMEQAATIISKQYKAKQVVDKREKDIGDLLCEDTLKGSKDIYRANIKKKISEKQRDGIITNLYLYSCKLGAKILGYDDKSKITECIKEIKNSVLLNLSLSSTNLEEIKFTNVQFYNLTGRNHKDKIIYNRLSMRNPELKSTKLKNPSNNFDFTTANIVGCLFENCLFYKINFYNNRIGKKDSTDVTRFLKSHFIEGEILFPFLSDNAYTYRRKQIDSPETDTDTLMLLDSIKGERSNKLMIYDERKIEFIPQLIFEDCIFDGTEFFYKLGSFVGNYLFLNCTFNKTKKKPREGGKIKYRLVNFINCKFNDIHFAEIEFDECSFTKCQFNGGKFSEVTFNKKVCIFNDCNIINMEFFSCSFHNYLAHNQTTIFRNDCVINNNKFIFCYFICFTFNYDNHTSDKIMNVQNNDFVCCHLYGTNFDLCDLKNCKFVERVSCTSYITCFGCAFIKFPQHRWNYIKHLYLSNDVTNNINTNFREEILSKDQYNINQHLANLLYIIDSKNYRPYGVSSRLNDGFLTHVQAFDSINISHDSGENITYIFLPKTSFKDAIIQGCNFGGIEGMINFDFTQVSKITEEDGIVRPNLNSVDLTNVVLTNANLTNANLFGTNFTVADVTGVNFQDTLINDNTNFEDVLHFELAENAGHINVGELQNRANETHATAAFYIENRKKINDFMISGKHNIGRNSESINLSQAALDMTYNIWQIIYDNINTDYRSISNQQEKQATRERDLIVLNQTYKQSLKRIFIELLNFSDSETRLLQDNLDKIITPEYIQLLISPHELNGERWSWLELTTISIKFLSSCSELYIYTFLNYYFNEVFNAHGVGSSSCVMGMIERWCTIHSQTCEYINVTLAVENPTSQEIASIQQYNSQQPSIKDKSITRDYMKYMYTDGKYILNQLINLIKSGSDLPENKEEDPGIIFDNSITPPMRNSWEKKASEMILNGEITTIEEFMDHYVSYIVALIIDDHGTSEAKLLEKFKDKPKPLRIIKNKIDKLTTHIKEIELPPLIESLKAFSGKTEEDELMFDELGEYYDGDVYGPLYEMKAQGRKNKRTRKAKGLRAMSAPDRILTRRSRSKSRKSISRRAKSDSQIDYRKMAEKDLLLQFANSKQGEFTKFFIEQISRSPPDIEITLVKKSKDLDIDIENDVKSAKSAKGKKKKSLRKRKRQGSKFTIKITRFYNKLNKKTKSKSKSNTKAGGPIDDRENNFIIEASNLNGMDITDVLYRKNVVRRYAKIEKQKSDLLKNKNFIERLKKEEKKQESTSKIIQIKSRSNSRNGSKKNRRVTNASAYKFSKTMRKK
jgi:uncharacterized protein YjbI with pentapeptide repeats